MRPPLHHLSLVLGLGFFLIALTTGYWGLIRGDELLTRADNPRRILAEQRQQRGSILDRHGEVLAESIGAPGEYARYYPYPDLAPVLGYISPFYGLAGIEAAEDTLLHGDAGHDAWELFWQEALGEPATGRAVRLSIDLQLQRAADAALGENTGVVLVLDTATGEILALASHPTFDANQLEDEWATLTADSRAPLLNRATLALYQPGGALQPALLAAALDGGLADLQQVVSSEPLTISASTVACRDPEGNRVSLTLQEAFHLGCPRPFADLGESLGADALTQLFTDWRLYEAPGLGLPSVSSPFTTTLADPAMSAIGQGPLTLTPLHVALLNAAIANRGEMPAPQIILAAQNSAGQWETTPPLGHPIAVFRPQAAEAVKALMVNGHSAVALTGEGERATTLMWFSGFAPDMTDPRYGVTVLLENPEAHLAEKIGQAVLTAIISK